MCDVSFSACGSEAAPNTEVSVSESVSEEEQSSDSVIRNIKWGMSIDEVKSSETAEFDSEKENKSLRYKNIDMFGQKFDLTYAFDVSDGLYSAVYGSPDLMPDDAAALQKSIIDTLTEKYGKVKTAARCMILSGIPVILKYHFLSVHQRTMIPLHISEYGIRKMMMQPADPIMEIFDL